MPRGVPTTRETLAEVRRLRAMSLSCEDIGTSVGLATRTVSEILRRPERWKDVFEPPDMRAAPIWCNHCKAMVHPPCGACQLREWLARHP